jgi:hypothetical protein
MKQAIGNYENVKPLTRQEAIDLAQVVFKMPVWIDMIKARQEWSRACQEWSRACQEWSRAWREWSRVLVGLGGFSPDDWRAVNFIASDLPNHVYSAVYSTTRNRNEVWVYDGVNCPNPNAVEVIWYEGNAS